MMIGFWQQGGGSSPVALPGAAGFFFAWLFRFSLQMASVADPGERSEPSRPSVHLHIYPWAPVAGARRKLESPELGVGSCRCRNQVYLHPVGLSGRERAFVGAVAGEVAR